MTFYFQQEIFEFVYHQKKWLLARSFEIPSTLPLVFSSFVLNEITYISINFASVSNTDDEAAILSAVSK